MKLTSLSKYLTSLVLGAALVLVAGCGGGDSSSSVTIDPAAVSQLEAKVAQGDADAAMKLGEMYAAKTGDREAQMTAAKWFHISARLGNSSAAMGLSAVTSQMSFDDQAEVERRVESYKLPTK